MSLRLRKKQVKELKGELEQMESQALGDDLMIQWLRMEVGEASGLCDFASSMAALHPLHFLGESSAAP